MPSALQDTLQAPVSCNTSDSNDCEDGLGLNSNQYNLLYAVYGWSVSLVVIPAGFLIDKLGNSVGLFLFSGLCLLGSCLFAVGTMLKGTAGMFPLLLLGRLLLGSGNYSVIIVQSRIIVYWFRDKELAFAFGIYSSFSRAGNVVNFFITKNFANSYGLVWTFWGSTFLVGICFLSAIVTSVLDSSGIKQLGKESFLKSESEKVQLKDIIYLSSQYWLLALTIMFFFSGLFPFVADASEYIKTKYNYSDTSLTPSYYAGIVYDVSLVLVPIVGMVIDFIGVRGILVLCSAIFTMPVFAILAFTHVSALVCTLWLGVTYSFGMASLWPSIPLVVPQATIGTTMGLTISIQMLGVGISNVIIGEIAGDSTNYAEKIDSWKRVMIFLLSDIIACVFAASLLNIVDKKRGGILNESRREKEKRLKDLFENSIQSADYNHEAIPLLPELQK